MTIQIARSNTSGNVPSSLQDGQLAINQADGVLFSRNPDGTIKRNLLAKRTGVADAAFTARFFDTYIGIASLTASRTLSLPSASSYPPGSPLAVVDESGAVSPTVTLTVAANGSDKINGSASLALTAAFGGTLLYSDGTSKWTAIALPAGAAANALLYVTQSLTAGQQDQARFNLLGALAASPTATSSLAALDLDRDQFVTGTSTLTMPATTPGWRSGIVTNDNATTGLVTLAVPAGHLLDGVANGSITLFPRQRARLRMIAASTWRTDWVDRSPILAIRDVPYASALAAIDFALPDGYRFFELRGSEVQMTVDSAGITWRASFDAGGSIKSDATYAYSIAGYSGNTGQGGVSYGLITGAVTNAASNTYPTPLIEMLINPGGVNGPAAQRTASILSRSFYMNTQPAYDVETTASIYYGQAGRMNLIRLFARNTGNISGGFTLRGIP